jgi:tetratricopeptide (TPR) repeat protein
MTGQPKPTGPELVEQLLQRPDNWELRLAAAATLAAEGRPGEAMAVLDAAPSPPGDESDLLQCAELYARTQPAKAVSLLHAWLQLHPDAPVVHLAMADTAFRLGDRDGAAAYYRRAIEIQPEYRDPDLEIRYGLAAPREPEPEPAAMAPNPVPASAPSPAPPRATLPRPTAVADASDPAATSASASASASSPGRSRRRASRPWSPMATAVLALTALGVFLTGWLIVALVLRSLLMG